jgi:hypothetical protein
MTPIKINPSINLINQPEEWSNEENTAEAPARYLALEPSLLTVSSY